MPRSLELCAGSGAVSSALNRAGWETTTLDLQGDQDIIADVRTWRCTRRYDFVWASPPCTEYSLANPRRRTRSPDRSIWYACLDRISESGTRHYLIENVRGAVKFWGPPISSDGRTWFFWGRLPGLPRALAPRLKGYSSLGHVRAAATRATIPKDLAELIAGVATMAAGGA